MSGLHRRDRLAQIVKLALIVAAVSALADRRACAQVINPAYADRLTFSLLTPNDPIGDVAPLGNIAQMAMSPNGKQLFVASYTYGIVRFDYGVDANGLPTLSNATDVWRNDPPGDFGVRGSLGLAFHQDPVLGTVLYFDQAVPNVGGYDSTVTAETGRLETVRRITDSNGDGVWGGNGDVNQAILNNIQVNTAHQMDNIVVRDNSLFVGIGTQGVPGNNEAAYNGTISWIQDLTQLSGDTTTANLAGFDTPAGNGLGADGWHVDTRPFTSTNPGKLRVYSTGARNPFGVALEGIDHGGDVWFSMNQQEEGTQAGLKPDELHHTHYQADHGFPKWYQTDGNMRNAPFVGPTPPHTAPEQAQGVDVQFDPLDDNITNWKTDPTATGAGFFNPSNAVAPVTTLGDHASADGLDFYYGNNEIFNGDVLVSRWVNGDVLAVDPTTGDQKSVVTGMQLPLSVLRVPGGMLLSDFTGISYLRFLGDLSEFKLKVDRSTGEVAMTNVGGAAIALQSYEIRSDAGNLNPDDGAWQSLSDQGIEGWQESAAGNSVVTGENLSGTTLILPNETQPLGKPYAPDFPGFAQAPEEDLEFQFGTPGRMATGEVEYVGNWLNTLVVHVDRATGDAVIQNPTEFSANFRAYAITSASNSLETGFAGLADHGVANWHESTVTTSTIVESNVSGGTLIAAGGTYSLTGLFDPSGAEDLVLRFIETNLGLLNGVVIYDIAADFNDDGTVDAADYTIWRDTFGQSVSPGTGADGDYDGVVTLQDYQVWRADFGYSAATAGESAQSSVPESSCWISMGAALFGLTFCRARNLRAWPSC